MAYTRKIPLPESDLIKKGKEAAKRKKESPEELGKKRSAAAKKSSSNIANHRITMTAEQIETANAKQRKPNLKPSQLAEMEALWESGEMTLKELSERFGRDTSAISRHMTLNNVIQGSRAEEYGRMIREKIATELAGDAGENARKIKKMKDEYIGYNEALNKLVGNELQTARSKGLPLQSVYPNLKAIKEAASIFAMTRTENWALLNVIDFEHKHVDADIPELLISELTGADIEKMRIEQLQSANLTGELLSLDLSDDDDDIVDENE